MIQGLPRFKIMMYLAGCLALTIVPSIALPGIAHAAATPGSSGIRPADSSPTASPSPALASLLLGSADLPPGFRLDAKLGRTLGAELGRAGFQGHTWARDWWSERTKTEVRDVVEDAGTQETAQAAVAVFDSAALKAGMIREPLAKARFVGYRRTVRLGSTDYLVLTLSMARGPYLFSLTILTPVQSSASGHQLMSRLAVVQSHKVPNDTPNTELSDSQLLAYTEGYVIGSLLIYLCIVNGVAYLQNPLRGARKRGQPHRALRQVAEPEVEDVSIRARNSRGMAQLRLIVQVFGSILVLNGADGFRSGWYVYLLMGSIIMWAAGRYIQPGGFGSNKNRMALAGRRRFRVAALLSAAPVMVIVGLGLIIGAGVQSAQPQGGAATDNSGIMPYLGLALVSAGAICHRGARRLGAVEARRLMLRDSRPAVLYLRSFGDDGLKLWTATLGRLSFIERFDPHRFDAFEEVLARHLSFVGPVVALNAPGTSLSPLGAARETIGSADWRSTVATWMDESALIIFVAPPEQMTAGLLWELERVSVHRHWAKTLIVVPPARPENLERRWNGFLNAVGKLWPFAVLPSVHDLSPLVLAFRNNTWTVITARRRDEWSYGAALHQAWMRSGQGQGPHVEGRPQSSATPAT